MVPCRIFSRVCTSVTRSSYTYSPGYFSGSMYGCSLSTCRLRSRINVSRSFVKFLLSLKTFTYFCSSFVRRAFRDLISLVLSFSICKSVSFETSELSSGCVSCAPLAPCAALTAPADPSSVFYCAVYSLVAYSLDYLISSVYSYRYCTSCCCYCCVSAGAFSWLVTGTSCAYSAIAYFTKII